MTEQPATLDQIIGKLSELVELCETLSPSIANHLNTSVNEVPSTAFNQIAQNSIMALELLSFYKDAWTGIDIRTLNNPIRVAEENRERVHLATMSMFVLSISVMEHNAKQLIEAKPNVFASIQKRIYLDSIMGKSAALGIISEEDRLGWKGIVSVRNTLIHNNGHCDESAEYVLSDGTEIRL